MKLFLQHSRCKTSHISPTCRTARKLVHWFSLLSCNSQSLGSCTTLTGHRKPCAAEKWQFFLCVLKPLRHSFFTYVTDICLIFNFDLHVTYTDLHEDEYFKGIKQSVLGLYSSDFTVLLTLQLVKAGIHPSIIRSVPLPRTFYMLVLLLCPTFSTFLLLN